MILTIEGEKRLNNKLMECPSFRCRAREFYDLIDTTQKGYFTNSDDYEEKYYLNPDFEKEKRLDEIEKELEKVKTRGLTTFYFNDRNNKESSVEKETLLISILESFVSRRFVLGSEVSYTIH